VKLKRKRLTAFKSAVLGAFLMTGVFGQSSTVAADEDVLHLGLTFWITGGKYGYPNFVQIKDLFEEVNAKGGINGRKVKITEYDTTCTPNKAVDNATKLAYEDKVLLIIGAGCSSSSIPMIPIITKAGVPMFSSMSSNDKVTNQGSAWIFRTSVADRFYAKVMGEYVYHDLGARKIAYVYSTDAAPNGFAKGVRDHLRNTYGLEPVADEEYQYKSTDLRSFLMKAKAAGPLDALFISDQQDGIALGVRQSFEVGIPKSVPRLHTSSAALADVPKLLGDMVIGSTYSSSFAPDNPDPRVAKFVKWYEDKYDQRPDHLMAQSDDLFRILLKALKNADIKNTPESLAADRAAIRDEIAKTKDFLGVNSGPISFCADPTPDCRDGNRTAMVVRYTKGGKNFETEILKAVQVPMPK